jgi:hypothetical protein
MKEEKEIEKCPCCGGTASIGTLKISSPSPIRDKNGSPRTESYFVNCQHCQMNNNGIVHGYTTETEAIDAWSRRASSSLTAKLEKATAALRIYANVDNWGRELGSDEASFWEDDRVRKFYYDGDGFKLAADVLKEIE